MKQENSQDNVLFIKMKESLHHFFSRYGLEKTYWIAFSGGLDSHVLLALCRALRDEIPIKLRAIHINHGLHPQADAWSAHCARLCVDYEIDYIEQRIEINLNTGDSLEELARNKRYAVFTEWLQPGDMLLTAHHQDDQAETVLLQLLRGAGPKGLAAMPQVKSLGHGYHARPLLHFTRSLIQQYAKAHQLKWIEDESNQNIQLARNFIRHEILPLLQARWPSVASTIARSAAHCSEAQVLLEDVALQATQEAHGSQENTLSVKKLLQLDAIKQRFILRTWIQQLGFTLPDTKKMEMIQKTVLNAAWDRMPSVGWGNVELRRYRDDLYLMRKLPQHDSTQLFSWELEKPLSIPGIGTLHAPLMRGKGLHPAIKQVSIQFRQGGETISMPGRFTHTLKNIFQEWKILPWERNRIPMLIFDNQLIGLVGYFIHSNYTVSPNEVGYMPMLQK